MVLYQYKYAQAKTCLNEFNYSTHNLLEKSAENINKVLIAFAQIKQLGAYRASY